MVRCYFHAEVFQHEQLVKSCRRRLTLHHSPNLHCSQLRVSTDSSRPFNCRDAEGPSERSLLIAQRNDRRHTSAAPPSPIGCTVSTCSWNLPAVFPVGQGHVKLLNLFSKPEEMILMVRNKRTDFNEYELECFSSNFIHSFICNPSFFSSSVSRGSARACSGWHPRPVATLLGTH